MKPGLGRLAGGTFIAVLIGGCGNFSVQGQVDLDPAAYFAMEACQITEVEDADRDGKRFERLSRSGKSWLINDPIDDLRDIADGLREMATAAEAASQLDDQWRELATAMTFNFTLVSRVVSLRPGGRLLTQTYMEANWPDISKEGRRFNDNLNKIEVICGGLMRKIEGT